MEFILLHYFLILNLYLVLVLGFPSFIDDIIFSFLLFLSVYRGLIRKNYFIALSLAMLALVFSFFMSPNKIYPNLFFGIRDYYFPMLSILIGATLGGRLSHRGLGLFLKSSVMFLMVGLVLGLLFPETQLAVTHTSDTGPDSLRAGVFFTNPNTLAYYLCITLIMLLSAEHVRSSDGFIIILMLIILLFTTSRSGLGIFISLLIIRFSKRIFGKPAKSIFIISTVSILFLYIVPVLIENFENLRLTRYASAERIFKATVRMNTWLSHLEEHRSLGYLVFGKGASVLSRPDGYDNWVVFDSAYLKYFLEIGIFGVLCFLGAFLVMYRSLRTEQCTTRVPFMFTSVSQGKFIFLGLTFFLGSSGLVSSITDVYPVNYLVYLFFGIALERTRINA